MKPGRLKEFLKQTPDPERGNGITIFGTAIMLAVIVFIIYLMQMFSMHHQTVVTQQAADTIADTVAVYMVTDGDTYADARAKATDVMNQLNDYTGACLTSVSVDKDWIENNVVQVTVSSKKKIKGFSFGSAMNIKSTSAKYTIKRTAATKWNDSAISDIGEKIVAYARSWINVTPYVHGGGSLETGTDCSNFLRLIFGKFGYSLPGGSMAYWLPYGGWIGFTEAKQIPASEVRAGDIIVFSDYSNSTIHGGHVGLCTGNGTFIHCSTSTMCVTESLISTYRQAEAYLRITLE